jgi:hypothetical protein
VGERDARALCDRCMARTFPGLRDSEMVNESLGAAAAPCPRRRRISKRGRVPLSASGLSLGHVYLRCCNRFAELACGVSTRLFNALYVLRCD